MKAETVKKIVSWTLAFLALSFYGWMVGGYVRTEPFFQYTRELLGDFGIRVFTFNWFYGFVLGCVLAYGIRNATKRKQ